MFFWIFAALLTLAASLAVMRPFLRGSGGRLAGAEHDLAVYRDQLAELEQEVQRGLISESDAAEARAEIGRRILRLTAAQSTEQEEAKQNGKLARAIAISAVLAVPLVSWGLYSLLGSPGMPAQPLEARLTRDPSEASVEELVARAEAYLAEHPDDARGWETLAPIYARLGRYEDAVAAWQKTIAIAGPTADREAAAAEAMVGASRGIITADAEAAFRRALALDAENPRARFFIAMGRAQEGKYEEARAVWQKMATELPAESPWKEAANQALAGLKERSPANGNAASEGPSDEQIADAENMSPEARRQMIEGMVASLDAKLRDNPADSEGWRRLIRSYVVLGRHEDAARALERGMAALGADSTEGKALAEFSGTLGITQSE